MGFDYEIQFKQGKDNQAADALSRSPLNIDDAHPQLDEMAQLAAISYPYSSWMDDLQQDLEKDTWVFQKKSLVVGKESDASPIATYRFQFDNGFLKYKGRIVLSPTSSWRDKIFNEFHSSPLAGHEGFLKTYKRINRSFYWEGMKKDIKDKVVACSVCQVNKYETLSPPGLLQPLPVPTKAWVDI
ncbi:hypothetical protein COP1_020133 [Malus domestica]